MKGYEPVFGLELGPASEPPPGVAKLLGSDASHAWAETWLPGSDWTGFDPPNGKLANIEFIILAWGRDFMDVTTARRSAGWPRTHARSKGYRYARCCITRPLKKPAYR